MGWVSYCQGLQTASQTIPVILLTKEGSEDFALAVLRAGINDYLKEPHGVNELSSSISRCLSQNLNKDCSTHSKNLHSSGYISENLVGESQVIKELRTYITQVSETDSDVLITGETGTGKELVSRLIHENSTRRKRAFVCVNCAAIPETLLESELFGHERGAYTGAVSVKQGKMELAQRGTILFDEIGDMGPLAQAKILRAIEERKIQRLGGRGEVDLNIRVIAATNQDLESAMAQGHFRKDLYYRLNVARIQLPSLKQRKEDIPLLLSHYIRKFNKTFKRQVEGLTEEALNTLLDYSWPGNIRELKNLMEATFINLPRHQITLMDLPHQFRSMAQQCEFLPKSERDRILSALLGTNWNRGKTANKLQLSRMTLYRKMLKYNISHGETENKLNRKRIQPVHPDNDVTPSPPLYQTM